MSPVPPCVSRGSKEELDSQQEFQRGDVLPKFVCLVTLCTRERHIAMGARSPETQFGTCLNTPHLPYS